MDEASSDQGGRTAGLNPGQRAAVEHRGGPVLVLAGAGTGKTRVITHRVASLLDEGIPPWRILAVTFTNRAAGEMRERIEGLCEADHNTREIWVGTFHSICARILRQHGTPVGLSNRFSIYDSADQQSVMRKVLEGLNVSPKMYTPRGVLGILDKAKNRGYGPEDLEKLDLQDPVLSIARKAYEAYQARLRAADAADFGDLLLQAVRLLRAARKTSTQGQLGDLDPVARLLTRFDHVVVDEFQDTNPIQAELVDLLSSDAELCVVGDDDQAIYGWRGADVDQILLFGDRHRGTEIVKLEQNYRSTTHILSCADAVIRKNRGRLGKTLWSELGPGEPVRVLMLRDERDEARLVANEARAAIDEGVDPPSIAIFYRTHAQSRVIEDELRRAGISCRIVGGVAFYERLEVKDVLSYLSVLLNPHSDVHLARVVNRPARKIGNTTVTRLANRATEEGVSLWTAMANPEAAGLAAAAVRRIREFVAMIGELQAFVDEVPLPDLLAEVVERTGYAAALAVEESDESHARLENLQELSGNLIEFTEERPEAKLSDYLELVSLVGGERSEGDKERAVTMMTVHSAKGLEFERVYLTGMEERVFPHSRVLDDPVQMEEERRLAYVAVTRAKRHLTLTMCQRRMLYGQTQVGSPSRFVLDLPAEATDQVGRAVTRSPRVASPRQAPVRKGPAWQNDIVYDESPDAPFTDEELGDAVEEGEGVHLFIGMHLRHKAWGEGELVGWHGSGRSLKLQIKFPGRGLKTVVASFVQPV
ncbi:MAG: UvrD-helicase domain-containing protein [Nannocystaceae bacterium]|nr:UvrD-helicase domain-containing protein [Nannocystaceae bacterium]